MSPGDQVEINILLSLTYKRLQDYVSVKYYLSRADAISRENKLTELYNEINAQYAFAYFDTQDYDKSATIMQQISKENYKNLSEDDKAKIMMQQGYIYYRQKDFRQSQNYYQQASSLMQKNSNCDLPIVYGKQIQLYFSLNDSEKAHQYYQLGIDKAKECRILKYEIYLAEVMMNFYKEKNDAENTLKFTTLFDSLNKLYKPSENLQLLHLNRDLKAQETEQKIKKSNTVIIIMYSLAILILCIVIYFIVRYALATKKNNSMYLDKIDSMKQILINNQSEKNRDIELKKKLSPKQLRMLELMKEGKSNKEIGCEFNITESTVKYHIKSIYEILNIRTRKDLKDIN
ncbi:LuxR family transcriptional regulator [uncultured Chryseobacterium sp.]|uniref:tetratricopeptide repeat protein n=1 Tax=uncultured Chryseobacterium sp. TaxID=259322 RepID=UPI0025F92B4D|nr:LuxR family transcriptional regulator [uncultured Chryseobacterium sp.]